MSDQHWLGKQLDQADREVQAWDAWKRDTMRREATAISSDPHQLRDADTGLQQASTVDLIKRSEQG